MIKKLFIAMLVLICTSIVGLAQNFNCGLEAGYDYNHVSVHELWKDTSASSKNGFKVAALAEWTWKSNITFTTGLGYAVKDCKLVGFRSMYAKSVDYNSVGYLQIPLLLGYRFELSKGFSIMPQIGIFGDVGVSGKATYIKEESWPVDGGHMESHEVMSILDAFQNPSGVNPYNGSNRFQYGMTYAVSAKYRNFGLKLGFDQSLSTSVGYAGGKFRTFYASAILWLK